jgi:EmrB/QacA subfamily drug resistance transporter
VTHPQRLTLAAAILGSGVATLDGTIVNVALPAIERDLGGGLPGQQWVANAYLLTLASLILIGGSLGDIYGERRVFSAGVAAFGLFSIACAVAPTIETLIAARALQGAAGALLTPSSLAIIVAAFSGSERGAAIGAWTAWGGIAAIVGPLAGGWIVDQASWRWIFLLNVPLIALTLVLVFAAVPRAARVAARKVDLVGASLCVVGLGAFVFALIEQPRYGWTSPVIYVPLIAGPLALLVFLAYERRAPEPMLDLGLFARRNFAVGNAETLAVYAGLAILFFFLVIFLQQVAGYTALKSGLATLPTTVILFAASRRFGALADRFGPRLFMGAGPLVGAAGILLLLRTGLETSYVADLLPGLVLFSIGLAMTVAPLTAAVLADADASDAGIASAVNNSVARVAGLVGVSVVGVVVASTLPGDTFAENAESVRAFHATVVTCAALFAAGGVAGAIGIVNPRRAVSATHCAGGQLVGTPRPAAAAAPPRAGRGSTSVIRGGSRARGAADGGPEARVRDR